MTIQRHHIIESTEGGMTAGDLFFWLSKVPTDAVLSTDSDTPLMFLRATPPATPEHDDPEDPVSESKCGSMRPSDADTLDIACTLAPGHELQHYSHEFHLSWARRPIHDGFTLGADRAAIHAELIAGDRPRNPIALRNSFSDTIPDSDAYHRAIVDLLARELIRVDNDGYLSAIQ